MPIIVIAFYLILYYVEKWTFLSRKFVEILSFKDTFTKHGLRILSDIIIFCGIIIIFEKFYQQSLNIIHKIVQSQK